MMLNSHHARLASAMSANRRCRWWRSWSRDYRRNYDRDIDDIPAEDRGPDTRARSARGVPANLRSRPALPARRAVPGPQGSPAGPRRRPRRPGRGRHAECRQPFGRGRPSLLGGQSRSRRVRRRTLRRALRHYWPSLASLVLVGAVMAAAWLTASLAALPEPTPRPVVAWSTPSEVCTVVPGSGDLSCYRGEIDHV